MSKSREKADNLKILATAGLILTDTMIFHEVLARANPKIKTLAQIKSTSNVKKALKLSGQRFLKLIIFLFLGLL